MNCERAHYISCNGHLDAKSSAYIHVTAAGQLTLENCTMKKAVVSHKNLTATDTNFHDGLYICDGKASLTNCTINNLYVDDWDNTPVITLRGNTIVTGHITFKTGNGKVSWEPGVVIQGEIIGGTITKIEKV